MLSVTNSLVKAAAPIVSRNVVARRTIISGPPTQRVPFMEKIILGTGMIASIFVFPVWVLVNVKHYKGPSEE